MVRNYCSNLLKESNTRHFNNLDVKDVTKNNRFWKIKTTFFTDKTKNSNNIILIENYQTIREDLTNVKKDLKFQQVDLTQIFKNEESCTLMKKHFGNGSFFLSQSLKMVLLAQSKNHLQVKHQIQITHPFH